MQRLAFAGFAGAALTALFGTAVAAPPTEDGCAEPSAQIEVDVATGLVYAVDPQTGTPTTIADGLDVYFGEQDHVQLYVHYSTGQWQVDAVADAHTSTTYHTAGGWVRFELDDDVEQYVLTSTEIEGASARMNLMTPVIPDIIIKTSKTCPPPP